MSKLPAFQATLFQVAVAVADLVQRFSWRPLKANAKRSREFKTNKQTNNQTNKHTERHTGKETLSESLDSSKTTSKSNLQCFKFLAFKSTMNTMIQTTIISETRPQATVSSVTEPRRDIGKTLENTN